jgi:putative SOS response-associated peptidase YedK
MCSNYCPSSREAIEKYFGVMSVEILKPEMYPGYVGPFIRYSKDSDKLECEMGNFGLMPHWAKPNLARSTYNARSETAAEKATFRSAWKKAQHCIIPVDWYYEPNYEQGKPVRWRIQHKDSHPVGVAGLWEWRPDTDKPDGKLSFTMLTVNADAHTLMKRFHAPDDEKRMIVILDREQYLPWLRCTADEAMSFMRTYAADALKAMSDPKPPKGAGEEKKAA